MSAVLLFLLVTAISLFIPAQVTISRAINLSPGNDSVLNGINDLAKWVNWYPGFNKVSLSGVEYHNNKMIKANAGGVRMAILTDNDSIVSVEMLRGQRPVRATWQLIHHSQSDSLTLRNYYNFHFKWYPWEKFSSLLLEQSYGPIMEQALKNLQQ